jgi:asparagine synthase (glutamine-hydrolysing)
VCGLVSILRCAGLVEHERGPTLTAMRDAIAHRGPDDASLEIVDGWVGLGHRRLSILDIEGAKQPLRDEAGSVVCVYNGEIYNFQVLRARLSALGHRFATQGDGEVIVHGYEQWGEDMVAMLEGMFAFVLIDRDRGRVLAARDRFGIKPLFWTEVTGGLLLASEIKGLLPHPEVRRVACGPALDLGLVRMHAPWPLTAFEGIFRLPPGALLTLDRSGGPPRLRRFAKMIEVDQQRSTSLASSGPALLDRAEAELSQAVRRQMVADVPVGAFLSGGIDSTLVVALMRRIAGEPLHTFSIGVDRAADDESAVARETARRLGTVHHEIRLGALRFEELVDLPSMYDEPFAETSALGVRALSRAAAERVKVVLTGDGGDEVFGGYDTYRVVAATDALRRRLPSAVSAGLGQASLRRLRRGARSERARRALRLAALLGMDPEAAHRSLLVSLAWCGDEASLAATERLSAAITARAGGPLGGSGAVRLALASDRLERLPNAMLTKVDIASMAASIEVRVPLLDDALVRFADTLPSAQLVGLRHGKLLLRRVLERIVPGGPAWAKKRGFALPVDAWVRGAHAQMRDLFHTHGRALWAIARVDAEAALDEFAAGSRRLSLPTAAMRLLWLATVALWAERHRVSDRSDDVAPEQFAV